MSSLAYASPPDLVPGDVDGVEALARRLGGFAQAAAGAADELRDVRAGSWVGPAGDAFRLQVSDLPGRLLGSAEAFAAAQQALSSYAVVLREARGTAARAIDLHAEGDRATARWQAAWAGHARAQASARSRAAAAGRPDPGRLPGGPGSADPGADERASAQRLLSDARARVQAAGDAAAARLRRAADSPPSEPSLLSRGMHQVRQFLAGAGEATWDLLELGFKLTPTYALVDPEGFVEHGQGLAQGLVHGVQDPEEFAQAVLDWDTWKENPARALGHLVPDLLLTVATAGTGAAARGARGLDAAGDLGAARRGLDAVDVPAPRRTAYDSLVDPRVGPDNVAIVDRTYDPLGGYDDAQQFAEAHVRPTGDPAYPVDWDWPPHDGAVFGTAQYVTPPPGTRIDRIGGTGGEYFSDPDTPFSQRSLPPDRLELPRREWEVRSDHPALADGSVRVERSQVAPWFGQPGGGVQYRFVDPAGTPLSNQHLWDRGLIEEVPLG